MEAPDFGPTHKKGEQTSASSCLLVCYATVILNSVGGTNYRAKRSRASLLRSDNARQKKKEKAEAVDTRTRRRLAKRLSPGPDGIPAKRVVSERVRASLPFSNTEVRSRKPSVEDGETTRFVASCAERKRFVPTPLFGEAGDKTCTVEMNTRKSPSVTLNPCGSVGKQGRSNPHNNTASRSLVS